MLRAGQTQIFAADGLIAGSAFRASEPAALIAEELHLVLLGLGQRCKLVKCSVQPEIRHDIAKLGPCQLPLQIVEVCQHFCGRGYKIQRWIVLFQVLRQQLSMNDGAVLRVILFLKQSAERIAVRVCEMLRAQ